MFRRTDEGLSNEYLFHGVDWIVYCEGASANGEVSSLDEAFWTKTLGEYGLRCYCKSMGSKTNLGGVIDTVCRGNAQNTIVALDRDYDHLTGECVKHPRIIYTYGYSWESDACLEFSIQRVVQLFANIIHCDTIKEEFRVYRATISRELKRAFVLDYKYHNHPNALFDRNKPLSIIDKGAARGPSIRKSVLIQNARTMEKHTSPALDKFSYQRSCGFRDFFGKAVSRMVYHWFVNRTSRLNGSRKVYYDGVMLTIVDSMDLDDGELERNKYYKDIVSKIV